ncbi:MAG: hypothetical protein VX127_09595 [Myxococcota bacterium]|nr:hypothetical protein [Myxococcota bacterium]
MNARFVWLGLVWTVACESQKATVVSDSVGQGVSLTVIPESSAATAGDDLGLRVVWASADGSQTAVSGFTLVSSAESDIVYDEDSVVVTVAGDHELTVIATDDAGVDQSASAMVAVDAGAPAVLSLSLSAASTAAGVPVEATIAAADAFGNATNADGAALNAGDDVTIDGASLTSTVAAEYVAQAELGELQAEAPFTVVAADPAFIDLVIEASTAEVGDDLAYSIAVADEYGNASGVVPVLSSPDGVVVDELSLTFDAEGVFEFTATTPDEAISDQETVTVDSSGPDLLVDEPDRGAWMDVSRVTVTGTASDGVSGLNGVTINGDAIDVADDDSFAHSLVLDFGINVIETSATDADFDDTGESNASTDIRSVLYSDAWVGPDSYRANALTIRISEGPGGLDQLGALAPDIMDTVDLDGLLGEDLYTTSGSIPILWWSISYEITMSATAVSYSDVALTIDATEDGLLDLRMTISDLQMDFVVSGSAPFADLPADGLVRMDAVHIDMTARPTIVDGALTFSDLTVDVPDPEGLVLEVGDGLLDLAGLIGLDVESLVVTEMRSAIASAVGDGGDALLDGVLGDFGVEESFEVSGMTYTLMAELGSVDVDDGGMTLGMDTRVVPDEVLSIGALDGPTEIPVFDWLAPDLSAGGAPLQMALSTDVLNQVMFAMWQGGLLDQALAPEDLGLDPTLLAVVLPSVDAVNIVTTPRLPPVFTPKDVTATEEGDQFDLTIGSMEVVLYDGDPAGDDRVMTLFVAMKVPMQLAATEGAIDMDLGEAEVWIDPTYVDPDLGLTAETIATLFSPILASFVPELTGELTSIPFPSLDGFSIAIDGSGMDGGDAPPGFWVADGALE